MTEVKRLAKEVREQNKLYEKGETDKAFWLGQQHRLEQMKEADPTLTQAIIGELVNQSQSWVATVLRWDTRVSTPFGQGSEPARSGDHRAKVDATRVLREPQSRKRVLQELEPAELAELARDAENQAGSKMRAQHARDKQEAKAVRQEHEPKGVQAVAKMLIGGKLDKARDCIIDANRLLAEMEGELTDTTLGALLGKAERTREPLDGLVGILAGDRDWDEGLAALIEEEK